MKLPPTYEEKTEWTILGPMGPQVAEFLKIYPLIGIDGGAKYSTHLDLWVGDGDSFVGEISAEHIFKFPIKKDRSDLALALNLFTLERPYIFHLWGFLGGRHDHELFNLGECLSYLDHHPGGQIIFYNGEGKISFHLLSEGEWRFEHQGTFSLGTMRKISLKLTGKCDYPIKSTSTLYPLSSQGLSNQAHGMIEIHNNGALFVYYPEGK